MKLKLIIGKIINNYEKTNNKTDNYLFKSTNRYLFTLMLFYLYHFFNSLYLFGFDLVSKVNLVMVLYWNFLLFLKKDTYILSLHIKTHSLIVYTVLLLELTLINIYAGSEAGLEFYYFPVLSSLPFFYNLKSDKIYVASVVVITLILYYVLVNYDFPWIPKSTYYVNASPEFMKDLKFLHFISSLIALCATIYFVYEKDQFIFKISDEKTKIEEDLNELEDRHFDLMKNQFLIHKLTTEEINEIYRLAETNSTLFFERFCSLFPNFQKNLLEIDPDIPYNDLYFCSLIKLNFDTKKIAQILNITVRAVESKKYRLKKKLKLHSHNNINEFLIKI